MQIKNLIVYIEIGPHFTVTVFFRLKPKPALPPKLQEKGETKNEQEINEVLKVNVAKSESLNQLLSEVVALTANVERKRIFESKV